MYLSVLLVFKSVIFVAKLKVEKLAQQSREYRQYHKAFYDSIFSISTISKHYQVNDLYEVHSPDIEARVIIL